PARPAQWLIWMIERGLYQLDGTADDEEDECHLEALTEIVWRVACLIGRQAGDRRTPASPSKSGVRNRTKSAHSIDVSDSRLGLDSPRSKCFWTFPAPLRGITEKMISRGIL